MALGVNFHPRTPIAATVRDLSTCTTFEVIADANDVTIYISTMEDAVTLLNAATELVAHVAALNAAKAVEAAADSITL